MNEIWKSDSKLKLRKITKGMQNSTNVKTRLSWTQAEDDIPASSCVCVFIFSSE